MARTTWPLGATYTDLHFLLDLIGGYGLRARALLLGTLTLQLLVSLVLDAGGSAVSASLVS